MIGSPPSLPDLRRASLADLRTIDLRGSERDFWADEAAIRDRFVATWAGLADEAWSLPGAAPSDAGGPDWSLAEHVGHVADWQELAIDYIGVALESGRWPSDDDYDGGDFDTYNERRREPWASMAPSAIRERLDAGRERLLERARGLSIETIRSDEGWGWVYMVLHGHRLDHLAVIEPWVDVLRRRQADGDPFVEDPRPPDFETFWAADHATLAEPPRPARAGSAGGLDEHASSRQAGRCANTSRTSPTGPKRAFAPSASSSEPDRGRRTRRRGSTPGTSDMSLRRRRRAGRRSSPVSTRSTTECAQRPRR